VHQFANTDLKSTLNALDHKHNVCIIANSLHSRPSTDTNSNLLEYKETADQISGTGITLVVGNDLTRNKLNTLKFPANRKTHPPSKPLIVGRHVMLSVLNVLARLLPVV
jgi:hypothetical protein